MIERVNFAGGGTGGHLFPGIAVMEELRRREPELEVLFVGTARGLETKVVPALGERLVCLEVSPLKGRSPTQLLKSLAALPQAGVEAARLVKQFRPSLVLGMGGYAAGPMVLAAKTLGVPSALLEQNAHVGLTNRLLARFVDRAYLSFEETAALFPARAARVFGNPVRRSFVGAGNMARMDPLGFEMRARRVLVVGGSQGAKVLNEIVPEALARAGAAARNVEIVHQTGHAMCESVRAHYERLGLNATVTPFIDDMARAYASAALVIGRAGATSLAEICAVGRPSLLIPFPFAADDHQWHNARALEARGAAVALREAGLDAELLGQRLAELLDQPERRTAMAEAARRLGRPEAAAAIVDDLCDWLGCASVESDLDGGMLGQGEPQAAASASDPDEKADAIPGESAFPPGAGQRRMMARRRARRRSLAWSQPDLYYGTRAVAALE
jgi:UDP-N-acetylglucosamine--N-acetylmuramyl-(pentapeptide) pyrophosphoryl-undecaprenol N-acetylglucosamine transferase